VVSDAADKTVVVSVQRRVSHPVYKKFITRSKKYMAHDEANSAKTGDIVQIRCWAAPSGVPPASAMSSS
jgi:small subunit ribosomal protein S17